MTLGRLTVENFRCIAHADLEFDPRCTLVSGDNASGKTSLLEAIYFLGRARSFRTARIDPLIRHGAEQLMVTGRVQRGGRAAPLGVAAGRIGIEGRLDGRPVSGIAELATAFPVQAIDPEVHRLIEEGPQQRRRFLDWGVFHVEPSFVSHWQRYQRALRQRNAALKAHLPADQVQVWDAELCATGSEIATLREGYLERLRPHATEVAQRLLGVSLELDLLRGWPVDLPLGDAIGSSWPRDAARGLTHVGPHRADLVIRIDGHVARDRISRGQQKLAAAALLLAQLRCGAGDRLCAAALLVDDPAAELDSAHLNRLLREVLALPVQLFATALDPEHPALKPLKPGRRFHVEHGFIHSLI